jgi:hypothetical protein
MLFSSDAIPTTIGWGKGGLMDRILHGSDSRHVDQEKREPPPSLQTAFYRSMIGQRVLVKLMDGSELVGDVLSVFHDGARLMLCVGDDNVMLSLRRIRYAIPQDPVDPVKAIETDMAKSLHANAENSSRLMSMKIRLQQRKLREAGAKLIQRRE